MSPSPKLQVTFASAFSCIGDFFSNFWDSYFLSYGEFVELIKNIHCYAVRVRQWESAHYTKIGDAGFQRHVGSVHSASPSWTLDQPGTVASTASTSLCITRVNG